MATLENKTPAIDERERLIVALDVPSAADATAMVDALGDEVTFYKVGLELFTAASMSFVRELRKRDKQVFLDLKLFDIGETVARTIAVIAGEDVAFLTIHGEEQVMKAAVTARSASRLRLLAVTVLTSLDTQDLKKMGIAMPVKELAVQRAQAAADCGCDGVITSAEEARTIKDATAGRMLIVTPGIRPAGADVQDQKRVATPASAIANGADYLVIGRPITRATSPRDTAKAILAEMQVAFHRAIAV
jgi:orotidine-5'-phosphate decarboxylase